jgi:hypothetical protein
MVHLKQLEYDLSIDAWSDKKLRTGTQWESKIAAAIDHAEVAILLISADFLASKFIRTHELPRLLAKAKHDADTKTLVVPIIVSPSRFKATPELGDFQAINNPDQPLLGVSKCDQEDVFAQVADLVADEVNNRSRIRTGEDKYSEDFLNDSNWARLVKIGEWTLEKQKIQGAGEGSFLLSEKEYGELPFEVMATLQFSDFIKPQSHSTIGMNAGMVFGWLYGYYNILLTGAGMLIERVGRPVDATQKMGHLTPLQILDINDGMEIRFKLAVGPTSIELFVNDTSMIKLAKPDQLRGRVGLRAWRSKMTCSHFMVSEI